MKLAFPVKGIKYITQKYGENEAYYKQFRIGGVPLKGHEGIDLRAPNGTEILSCDSGTCVEVLDQGSIGYGKYIKIVHPWGESVYAHLQEFKIKQGTEIKKGQIIALADNTGNSSGAHLHFGIRINPYNRADGWGGYSDPEPHIFYEEEVMPNWVNNLKPFFLENNLKDDQVEGAVRDAFALKKILQGFVEKWVQKLTLPVGSDLTSIENEITKLMAIDDTHTELISSCEQVVGHYETEEGLRNALRGVKVDITEMSKTTQALIEENEMLKKRRTLDKYTAGELLVEVIKKIVGR